MRRKGLQAVYVFSTWTLLSLLQKKGQSYSVLLVLTNGDPADIQKTGQAIKDAEDSPLSIIFVRIGKDSFTGMQQMIQHHKATAERDLLQFVDYETLQGDEDKLTQAALNHIPNQMISYFVSKNILPLPEPEMDEIAVEPYNPAEEVEAPIAINEHGQAVVTGDVEIPERRKKFHKFMKGGIKEGKKLLGKIKKNKRLVGRIQRKVEQKILRMVK